MRQKLLLILFGIIAIVLGILISTKTSTRTNITPTASPTPRQHMSKTPVVVIPEEITPASIVEGSLMAAPKTLPLYSYSPLSLSLEEGTSLAKKLGFLEKPLFIQGETKTYQWSRQDSVLSFISKNGESWISFSRPTDTFSFPRIQTAQQGKEFITSLFKQNNACTIQIDKITNGPFDGVLSTESLTGYYYSCATPNNKQIVSLSFNTTLSSLIVNQEGLLRSFSLDTLFSVSTPQEQEILTPSEAITYLRKEGGILISLSREGDFSVFDSPPQFKDVILSSYFFVYYPNKDTLLLEPYYVFEGTTKTTEGEILWIKYAFPATVRF